MSDQMFLDLEKRYKAVCQELHDVTAKRNALALRLGRIREILGGIVYTGHPEDETLSIIDANNLNAFDHAYRIAGGHSSTAERDEQATARRLIETGIAAPGEVDYPRGRKDRDGEGRVTSASGDEQSSS